MVREELVSSAISFLRDPSVANSPIDKRKAFLQSKNLTDEEIEIALARAGDDQPSYIDSAQYGPSNHSYPNQQSIRQPPPSAYGYGPYKAGPWAQPPPSLPRRDWRDWFIMATVTGGVSYGLYTVAKRYVMPLIAPPTPPQLEQDKAAIDASFSRAFSLIDQLATDTAALKTAEAERNEKLDSALQEVESVVIELKTANKRREEDSRRIGDEVRSLKQMIPKALEGWKSEEDVKLKELATGLKSLKILVGNRMGDQGPANGVGRQYNVAERIGGSGSNTPRDLASQGSPFSGASYAVNGGEKQDDASSTFGSTSASAPAPGVNVPKRESSSIFGHDGRPGGRAAIPAWQMAAAGGSGSKGKSSASTPPKSTGGDGSAEASDTPLEL